MTSIKTFILCLLMSISIISTSSGQCTSGVLYPSDTFTPNCNGSQQLITEVAWTGEYSVIAVTAGIQYTFSSSVASDFITITNSAGTPLNWAVGSITGTPNFSGTLRFYRHNSSNCGASQQARSIFVSCGQNNPTGDITFYFGETLDHEDTAFGNNQIQVPVRTLGFNDVGGFQFTIRINDACGGGIGIDDQDLNIKSASGASLIGIQNIHPGLQAGLTIFVDPSNTFITLNWATGTSLSLANATKLFDVQIDGPPSPLGQNGCCDFLFFDDDPTPIFANNSSFDELNVITDDTHGLCPALPKICGCIYREDLVAVPNVEVKIERNNILEHTAITDVNGCYEYEVPNLNNNDIFTIIPEKLTNPVTNGINALDRNGLAQYISNPNGTSNINSGYKLIAGNVNTDQNINSIDLTLFNQALLGTRQQWLNGTPSWRFVPIEHNFVQADLPPTVSNVALNYPEFKTIQGSAIQSDNCHDFVGIKIGDIVISNNPSNFDSENPDISHRRQNRTLLYFGGNDPNVIDTVIVFQDNDMLIDSVIKLHLYTNDFTNIKAFETALKWDTDELSFYKVSTKDDFGNYVSDIAMTAETFRYDTANQRIIFFWDDATFNPEGRTFSDGTLVMVLEFKVKQKAIQSQRISSITNDNDVKRSLFFNKENREFEFGIDSGDMIIDFTNDTQTLLVEGIKVYPSITNGDLFVKNVQESTRILLYDNYGKVVYQSLIQSEANLNIANLPSGMYYLRLVSERSQESSTMKVIKN